MGGFVISGNANTNTEGDAWLHNRLPLPNTDKGLNCPVSAMDKMSIARFPKKLSFPKYFIGLKISTLHDRNLLNHQRSSILFAYIKEFEGIFNAVMDGNEMRVAGNA